MAYTTTSLVRSMCGLTTGEISDGDITNCISIADKIIDSLQWLSLDSSQKEIASTALSSHLSVLNTIGVASSDVDSISLGDLRTGRTSQLTGKHKLSTNFLDLFFKIISWGSYAEDLFIRTNV